METAITVLIYCGCFALVVVAIRFILDWFERE